MRPSMARATLLIAHQVNVNRRDGQVKQIWEQMFGPQAQGWPDLFGRTADGSRGKYTVEAIGDIDSKEA